MIRMERKISNFPEAVGCETKTSFPFVTEAGSGVVSEQRNRLVATIKFIYAGIQKLYKRKKRVIAN